MNRAHVALIAASLLFSPLARAEGGPDGMRDRDKGPREGAPADTQHQAQPQAPRPRSEPAPRPAAQPRRAAVRRPRARVSARPQGASQAHAQAPQARPTRWQLSPALKSRGVTQAPHRFSKRTQILTSVAGHSVIPMPGQGVDGRALRGSAITLSHFSAPEVRNRMSFIGNSANGFSSGQVAIQLRNESSQGHYYWHHDRGFDYCHYNDAWGYSWYGWYAGDSYFWTRYYADRWWAYDDATGRWSYWSGGNWYWQDPDMLSAVYLYDNGSYIAIN